MASAPAATNATSTPVCAICLEGFLPGANISKLNCNHEYHRDCLQPWLGNHNTCPLDREKITSINSIATEHAEEEESTLNVQTIEVQNPLTEARALHQRRIRVIQGLLHSADPIESQANKVQSIFSSIFRQPQ